MTAVELDPWDGTPLSPPDSPRTMGTHETWCGLRSGYGECTCGSRRDARPPSGLVRITARTPTRDVGDVWVTPEAAAEHRRARPPLRDRLLSRGELAKLPEPEPLIADTVDKRTVAIVAGHFGTLKSFVLQDWAACVATGRAWLGRDVEQGTALYVAAEGAHGLHPRFTAWEYGWRREIPDDALAVLPEPVNLLDSSAVAELCTLAAGRSLVVLDTLARCLVGGDENSARDVGMAVDALYRIRDATRGGTVVVAHHTGKDRSTIRGSSALEAGVDTVYATEGDARLMRMTRTKRKDGPCADVLQVKLSPVLDSGVVVSTLGVDIRPTAQELMSTFVSSFAATGATKADLRNAAALAPASFSRALNDLVKSGALVNHGTEQRPFYKLAQEG